MPTLQRHRRDYIHLAKKHRRDYVHLAKTQYVHKRKIACYVKSKLLFLQMSLLKVD